MKLSYCLVRQVESLACREHADQVEEQHPRCRRTVHLPSCFKVSLPAQAMDPSDHTQLQ
jgi:hypothetical protein